MSTLKVNNIQNASGTDAISIGSDGSLSYPNIGRRNLIINGDMRIDQRNAGASVAGGGKSVDRIGSYCNPSGKFNLQQNYNSVTGPDGFPYCVGAVSTSAYTPTGGDNFQLSYQVEANDMQHLNWGTANAKDITVSFWVRSSLTGNFGLVVENSGIWNYSYPILYTINAANTWEYKTITIPGPTSGSWGTGNASGFIIIFSIGIGTTYAGTSGSWVAANKNGVTGQTNVVETNGATFYVTGLQAEVGSVATPFEHRSYGEELALCQRYYYNTYVDNAIGSSSAYSDAIEVITTATTTYQNIQVFHPQYMRATPTITFYSPMDGSAGNLRADSTNYTANVLRGNKAKMGIYAAPSISSGQNLSSHFTADAEL